MAFSPSVDWDGTFKLEPSGIRSRSEGDDRFRDTKKAFRERFARSHKMVLGADNDLHGIHLPGTGKVSIEASDPTLNANEESVSDIGGYLNLDTPSYEGLRMWQVKSYSGSAWAGLTVATAPSEQDGIPADNFFVDSAVNVHCSTIINWLRTYLGGNYHGHLPATGTIEGNPVHGIQYVTTDTLIYLSLYHGGKELSSGDTTGAAAALLMIDSR